MIFRPALILTTLLVSACREPAPAPAVIPDITAELPTISKQFSCLPENAAFIAAHRGTSKRAGIPENSLSGLQALIEKGYLFAEIDIASIGDRTHILFHDGTWDEKSTGSGPVASTPQSVFQTIRLRDTEGLITGESPTKLDEYLKLSKNNIYLEIDFKSSADYQTVINAIRKHGMAKHVLLIAYNERQASRLAELAPDMMISASAKSDKELEDLQKSGIALDKIAVWRGRSPVDSVFLDQLRGQGVPVLRQAPRDNIENAAKSASLLVTDYAFDYPPIVGLLDGSMKTYRDCLLSN